MLCDVLVEMPQMALCRYERGGKTSYSWYFPLALFFQKPMIVCKGKGNMKATPKFIRRLGPDPHANGAQTVALNGCPDIFELSTGDFAIIGIDITDSSINQLPPTAGCGPDERIVLVPRKTLVFAKSDIPSRL
jgi:hypothetical protein